MKAFQQIATNLGLNANNHGPIPLGDDPPLTVKYNSGGAGYTPSLAFELNAGVHITIYQDSWDGTVDITDCTGGQVSVGPYCLHTTAGAPPNTERWFHQFEQDNWEWVTDCGTPSTRYLNAFASMMNTMSPVLS